MIPYAYYYYDGRYQDHYILSSLSSDVYFLYAAAAAMVFIFVFLLSCSVLLPAFQGVLRRVSADLAYQRLLTLVSALSCLFFVLVLWLSYRLNGGVFALAGNMDLRGMAETRHFLSQSGGSLALNKIFMKAWVPMLSYLHFYLYLIAGSLFKFRHKVTLATGVVAGLMAALFFLEKAVLFFYILGFLGVYVYAGRRLKRHYLPIAFAVSVVLVSLMYVLTYGDKIESYLYLKNVLVHRAATQSVGSVMSFEYFTDNGAKGMAGVSTLWADVLGESFSSPYSELIKHYVPETTDVSGSMSSFATGEAYGLFGIIGVLVSGFLVAVFLSFFEATKTSKALSVIFVGIYGLYFSHHYVASGFFSFVWPVGLVYNVLPFFVLLLLSLKVKRSAYGE
tara:strand:- start:610 stop:1785 length:1176 start_codon:yes stop_codon:yes gene_type:complete